MLFIRARASAALAAAQSGAQVALIDESLRLSGNDAPPPLVRAVHDSPSITLYPGTVAAGYYADHWVALAQQSHLVKMRAGAVVFATGVIGQPAVFRNNDLPGVMLAAGAMILVGFLLVTKSLQMITVVRVNVLNNGLVMALTVVAGIALFAESWNQDIVFGIILSIVGSALISLSGATEASNTVIENQTIVAKEGGLS